MSGMENLKQSIESFEKSFAKVVKNNIFLWTALVSVLKKLEDEGELEKYYGEGATVDGVIESMAEEFRTRGKIG